MSETKYITKTTRIKKATFVFITDPGHGWLKVPKRIIRALEQNEPGFSSKISQFSYERNKHVYLEEDCDTAKVHDKLKFYGVDVKIKSRNSNKSSKIRSYNHYSPNCL